MWQLVVKGHLSNTGPVIEVRFFVVVVVGVVVALPDVVLDVDLVAVEIITHVNISEDVLELGVVVEGHWCEWIEVVGVNGLRFGHFIPLFLFASLFLALCVGCVDTEVEANGAWVEKEVGAPAHFTESAQRV